MLTVSTTGGWNDGTWHHVVFTRARTGGGLALYVDGATAATGTGGTQGLSGTTAVTLGRNLAGTGYLQGSLDEVAFYSATLVLATVSYHLLALRDEPFRLRLQVWCDEGEPVESVVSIWPTADWHEREAWEMLGINIECHPNLARLLTEDDWDGHPLRKDYPLGGEPVRFSDAE